MSKRELRLRKEFQAELNAIEIETLPRSQMVVDLFNLGIAMIGLTVVFFFILH